MVLRSPDVLWRRLGREVILVDPEGERFDALSETAADVWRLLDEPVTVDEIATRLCERFGTPVEVVLPDVERLVRDLRVRGYVRRVDG